MGALIALALARPLNALALGDDAGRALGAHLGRTRGLGVLGPSCCVGAATAAAGPIGFVGLTVPHVARGITGPDQRWVLPYSMVLAPDPAAERRRRRPGDGPPGEIEVGIVTAFIGAPVFILLARRRRLGGCDSARDGRMLRPERCPAGARPGTWSAAATDGLLRLGRAQLLLVAVVGRSGCCRDAPARTPSRRSRWCARCSAAAPAATTSSSRRCGCRGC